MEKAIKYWEEQMDLLAQQDYIIIDDFFRNKDLELLISYYNSALANDKFDTASIGPSNNEQIVKKIRSDNIFWIDLNIAPELTPIFKVLDDLRLLLNRMLFLSLSSYEFHLANYPKGSFYKKHLDQFRGRNNRFISIILYLNEDWKKTDGGALRIYKSNDKCEDILPYLNRCVLFKSDGVFHEVLEAKRSRKSLTGWMLYEAPSISHLLYK